MHVAENSLLVSAFSFAPLIRIMTTLRESKGEPEPVLGIHIQFDSKIIVLHGGLKSSALSATESAFWRKAALSNRQSFYFSPSEFCPFR